MTSFEERSEHRLKKELLVKNIVLTVKIGLLFVYFRDISQPAV